MTRPPTGEAESPAGGVAWQPALARSALLRRDPVRQADLLIVPERIVVLNEEAAAIVALCDGERTVAGIVAGVLARFPGGTEADVVEFLDRIRAEGWLR
ncbi:pyrroloquinoline quinone biosynthesis peptide chaperone PqqD [Nonomuraea lactucae]|uniref:pyrroloquinoline quinone biosynthesis peptide chaperone PqqD n=1 Tax=Nonomuraea lactucae TaxID=2249762 RepID=UPI000DE4CDC3|nr:pyrroloquinoline quinone biosynthesis peptide chaperone PqqD [Nonomuraea lactucae]